MKTLTQPAFADPCERLEMKVQSVTMTTEDLERIDDLMELHQFKNRSAAVRACILFAHTQLKHTK